MGNQAPCVQSNTQDLDFNSEKYYVRNSEFEAMNIMRGVDRRETLGIIDRSAAAVILDQSDSDQEDYLQQEQNSDEDDLASYHSD